jgi:hypothetical protein
MNGKIPTILALLLLGVFLFNLPDTLWNAIAIGLLTSSLVLTVDVVFSWINNVSLLEKIFGFRKVKIYDDNNKAFEEIFSKYLKNQRIQTAIFVGYTADMQARNLQHFVGKHNTKIEELRILVKHPGSIGNSIEVNGMTFPPFPMSRDKQKNRRIEIKHSIKEIRGLLSRNFVQKCEMRGYYSLPSIRAIVLNNEIGFISLYTRHTTGDDLTGTTNFYTRISLKSKYEKDMLISFLEWFNHSWESSIEIPISDK